MKMKPVYQPVLIFVTIPSVIPLIFHSFEGRRELYPKSGIQGEVWAKDKNLKVNTEMDL